MCSLASSSVSPDANCEWVCGQRPSVIERTRECPDLEEVMLVFPRQGEEAVF